MSLSENQSGGRSATVGQKAEPRASLTCLAGGTVPQRCQVPHTAHTILGHAGEQRGQHREIDVDRLADGSEHFLPRETQRAVSPGLQFVSDYDNAHSVGKSGADNPGGAGAAAHGPSTHRLGLRGACSTARAARTRATAMRHLVVSNKRCEVRFGVAVPDSGLSHISCRYPAHYGATVGSARGWQGSRSTKSSLPGTYHALTFDAVSYWLHCSGASPRGLRYRLALFLHT